MRLIPLATALLLTLSLAACADKDEPAPATPAAAAAPAAAKAPAQEVPAEEPPLPTGDFRISSVTLGNAVDEAGHVRTPMEIFTPGDKIFAAVVSVGGSDGLTLAAQWTAADGTPVAQAGQSINPSTPTVATFSIAQPEPWPTGGYRVDIAINGRVVESRNFLVE